MKKNSKLKRQKKVIKKLSKFDNNYLSPKYNLSLMYLHNGDFKLAWKYFENRWKILTGVQNKVNEFLEKDGPLKVI